MFELRPYATEDAEAVLAIWWDSWHSIAPELSHPQPRASWRSRWLTEIVGAQAIVVVQNDAGLLVGFAAAHLSARELTQLFVAPACKRAGVGRSLLQWAQSAMPTGFKLHTLVSNVASRELYDKHGLVEGVTQINPVNGMQVVEYLWVPSQLGVDC